MTQPENTAADSIEALTRTVRILRTERDGLHEAMRNRAVIEQAKGVLAQRLSIDPEQAFAHLTQRSSRANVKLVEVAAAVVAETQGEPVLAEEATVEPPVVLSSTAKDGGGAEREPGELRSETRLIGSRITTATNFDELAASLAVKTLAWPAPDTVVVALVEGDGALRVVGTHGVSVTARSRWDRIPPIENVPIVVAVRDRAPVHLSGQDATSRRFPTVAESPHDTVLAVPLIDGETVLGALELCWVDDAAMDKRARSHLAWLAEPVSKRCAELMDAPEAFASTSISHNSVDGLVKLFVEALHSPAALLRPQYDENGHVIDFDGELANRTASPVVFKPDGTPASLLTVLPESGARELLPVFTEVLAGGESRLLTEVGIAAGDFVQRSQRVDVHVSRMWGKLFVTWWMQSEAVRHFDSLVVAEEAFGTGAFFWDSVSGEVELTPGLFTLIGLDPDRGAPSIDKLTSLIHPADREALVNDALEALSAGAELRKDLRGTGPLEGRVFEVVARARLTSTGEVRSLRGACRDITSARNLGDRLTRERISAAASRSQRDATKSILDQILRPLTSRTAGNFEITGHTAGPQARSWCDTLDLSADVVALLIGEVNGDDPAAAMLGLRHAVAAYAVGGMDPAETLTAANTAYPTIAPARSATLTVACLKPEAGELTWAASGQAAPILARALQSPHLVAGSLGVPVGVSDSMEFSLNKFSLDPGDQVLLYSESLLSIPDVSRAQSFASLRELAEATTAEEVYDGMLDAHPGLSEVATSLLVVRRRP